MRNLRFFAFAYLAISYCFPLFAQDGPPSTGGGAPPQCGRPSPRIGQHEREHSGHLDKPCQEATRKAEECCINPAQEKCGYKESNFGQKQQSEEERRISGIYQPAVNQSRDLATAYNRNRASASLCKTHKEKRKQVCAEAASRADQTYENLIKNPDTPSDAREIALKAREASRTYSEIGDQDFETYRQCHQTQADQNYREMERSLDAANASRGEFDGSWRVSCSRTTIGEDLSNQCYVQNTGEPTGDIVRGAERDKLPVRAVHIDGACTGYTDERGTLNSASHCRQPSLVTSVRSTTPGSPPEVALWRKQNELPFDERKFRDGEPWTDKNQFAPDRQLPLPEQFRGKPFYHLAEDTALNSGCEARGNVLACSPAALRSIQGTQAEVQGFPGAHFRDGPQDSKTEVLVTRGPAYYDPYSQTVKANVYAAPGHSGGPAYFREGTEIGGFKADRPVMIGPVSGGNWPRDPQTNLPIDGNVYIYSPRTLSVPVASVQDTTQLMIPRVQNDILRQGGSVFITPTPSPRPKSGGKRR